MVQEPCFRKETARCSVLFLRYSTRHRQSFID